MGNGVVNIKNISEMNNGEIGAMIKENPSLTMFVQFMSHVNNIIDTQEKMSAEMKVVKTKVDTIENQQYEAREELNETIDGLNEVKEDHKQLADKFDTMGNDNTGTFELFKATARKRVWNLVGNKAGSVKHILFFRPFMSKIYSDTYNHFGANNSGSIKMSDSELAIDMVRRWHPTKKYISDKLQEYVRMQSDGTLKEPRNTALNRFMEITDGGSNIRL